ncbi:MAG: hypothetical protein H6551_05155 [Chitinophagales bacterium]|nr:hypothetical protein [Chitinophagaceae bacterium]MCB9064516.1 hypothetical protein [Chitinophagales bacterium]
MSELDNIWNSAGGNISPEKLTAYLEGRLSAEEQREVELLLSDEGLESDAVEGLREVEANEVNSIAEKINYRLQHDIRKQSNRRKKLFKDDKWGWLAILIVIILCVLGFWVFKSGL